MGVSLAVVMEPVNGRVVSPVSVVAMDIVDEGGSVSVGTTVSAEVFGIEPKNIQKLYNYICSTTCAQNSLQMKPIIY